MFTGIIEKTARVTNVTTARGIQTVTIATPTAWKLTLGESISVNGICSTVAKKTKSAFTAQYMNETLKKTTAGTLKKGSIVNLERSLKIGERMGGHFVSGHVDGVGILRTVEKNGASLSLSVSIPKILIPLVAPHSSVTLNGVSLTVAKKTISVVTIALVPHTLSHTNLGKLTVGDGVNIEVDLMARHIAELLSHGTVSGNAARRRLAKKHSRT